MPKEKSAEQLIHELLQVYRGPTSVAIHCLTKHGTTVWVTEPAAYKDAMMTIQALRKDYPDFIFYLDEPVDG